MGSSSKVLFELIDDKLLYSSKKIKDKIFSEYRNLLFTSEQRNLLEPLVRKELYSLVQEIFGIFDNVGCVLPDECSGWIITSCDSNKDIREGNKDYYDMWFEFLLKMNKL